MATDVIVDLSQEERAVLVELLERERGELPAELHHTRTDSVRGELRERIDTVERLLARLTREP